MSEEPTIVRRQRYDYEYSVPDWRYPAFLITAILLIQAFTVCIVVVVWELLK